MKNNWKSSPLVKRAVEMCEAMLFKACSTCTYLNPSEFGFWALSKNRDENSLVECLDIFVKTSIFAPVFLDQQHTWTGSPGNMWSRPSNVWNVLFSKWIFDNMTWDISGLDVHGIFWIQTRDLRKSGFGFVTNPKKLLKGGLELATSPPCCKLYLLPSVALSQTGSVIMESLCRRKLEQPRILSKWIFKYPNIGSQHWISTNITSVGISPSNVSGKIILPGIALILPL